MIHTCHASPHVLKYAWLFPHLAPSMYLMLKFHCIPYMDFDVQVISRIVNDVLLRLAARLLRAMTVTYCSENLKLKEQKTNQPLVRAMFHDIGRRPSSSFRSLTSCSSPNSTSGEEKKTHAIIQRAAWVLPDPYICNTRRSSGLTR